MHFETILSFRFLNLEVYSDYLFHLSDFCCSCVIVFRHVSLFCVTQHMVFLDMSVETVYPTCTFAKLFLLKLYCHDFFCLFLMSFLNRWAKISYFVGVTSTFGWICIALLKQGVLCISRKQNYKLHNKYTDYSLSYFKEKQTNSKMC